MIVAANRYQLTGVTPKAGVVVHTSESGDGSLQALLDALQRSGTTPYTRPDGTVKLIGSAYHALADGATGNYIEVLDATAAPNSAPPLNQTWWHICMPGYARQTRDEWADPMSRGQIRAVARFIVDKHHLDGFPPTKVNSADLAAGAHGYCGHVDVTYAWHRTTHTDPGTSFPWDVLAADIAALTTPIEEDDMLTLEPVAQVYDTRAQGLTPFKAGEVRSIPVSYGGSEALLRLTAIMAGGVAGWVRVWGIAEGGQANVNFSPDVPLGQCLAQTRLANGVVQVRASAACHLIIETQAVKA